MGHLNAWLPDQNIYRKALMGAFLFRAQLLPEHSAELGALAEAAGLESSRAEFQWQPFYSLDDAMVLRRARQILRPLLFHCAI